jgi:signal transduction histidine kinase/DNA-binding response OmpR family regulator
VKTICPSKILSLGVLFLLCLYQASGQDRVSAEDSLYLRLKSIETALSAKIAGVEFPETEPKCNFQTTDVDLRRAPDYISAGEKACFFKFMEKTKPDPAQESEQIEWLIELALGLMHYEELDSSDVVINQLVRFEKNEKFAAEIRYVQAVQSEKNWRFYECFRYAEEAMEKSKDAGNQLLSAKLSMLIGRATRNVYTVHPDQPRIHLKKALKYFRSKRDTQWTIKVLCQLGGNYALPNSLGTSANYLNRSVRWMGPDPPLSVVYEVSRLMAICFYVAGYPDDAEPWLRRALPWSKLYGQKGLTSNCYLLLADIHMAHGNLLQAQLDVDSALFYQHPRFPAGFVYRVRAEVASSQGQAPLAVDYYRRAFKEQLKHYNQRNTAQINEWETQFRTQEKELELLQGKRERNLFIVLSIFLTLLLVGVLAASWKVKQQRKALIRKNETIEKQSKEIRSLDELKSRFYANVSHELRTPLTLIQGPLEQAMRENDLPETAQSYIHLAQSNSNRLLQLVNQLLDLERLGLQAGGLNKEELHLSEWLNVWITPFALEAELRNLNLSREMELDPTGIFRVDEEKLKKILDNLLSNALKYTEEGGSIKLIVREQEDQLEFIVSDTGRGIHEADVPNIFNRYYQASQTGLQPESGFGIGLALASELAQVMNGSLSVESRLGEGSSFYLNLPVQKSKSSVPKTIDILPVLDAENGSLQDQDVLKYARILLIEDNYELRTFIIRVLEQEGMQLQQAANGKQALEWLDQTGDLPELIITDLMMPEMNGKEFVKQIKSSDRYQHIPVLVLTARPDVRQELGALRIGSDDYLIKPFQVRELLSRLAGLLKNFRARTGTSITNENHNGIVAEQSEDIHAWLARLEQAVEHAMEQDNLSLDSLSQMMYMSSRQLQRRLKQATGLTFTAYLKECRFQKARQLIYTGKVSSVSELAGLVGMRDVKYFSKEFKHRFGKSPSELLSNKY